MLFIESKYLTGVLSICEAVGSTHNTKSKQKEGKAGVGPREAWA